MSTETGTDRPVELSMHRDDSIARLVIGGTPGNIITSEVIEELHEQVFRVQEAPDVSLVTIEGTGRNFSFGASVEEHLPEEIRSTLPALHRLILEIAASAVPIAALVRGRCLGGAFELAAACHFIFAGQDSRFALPEIRLGVFPPAACALLPGRIGQSLTDRLVLTGEEIDAASLRSTGLVSVICHDDELFDHALDWHRQNLAPLSVSSLRIATRAARRSYLHRLRCDLLGQEETYLHTLVPTEDATEGITAFLEKRDPVWRNR